MASSASRSSSPSADSWSPAAGWGSRASARSCASAPCGLPALVLTVVLSAFVLGPLVSVLSTGSYLKSSVPAHYVVDNVLAVSTADAVGDLAFRLPWRLHDQRDRASSTARCETLAGRDPRLPPDPRASTTCSTCSACCRRYAVVERALPGVDRATSTAARRATMAALGADGRADRRARARDPLLGGASTRPTSSTRAPAAGVLLRRRDGLRALPARHQRGAQARQPARQGRLHEPSSSPTTPGSPRCSPSPARVRPSTSPTPTSAAASASSTTWRRRPRRRSARRLQGPAVGLGDGLLRATRPSSTTRTPGLHARGRPAPAGALRARRDDDAAAQRRPAGLRHAARPRQPPGGSSPRRASIELARRRPRSRATTRSRATRGGSSGTLCGAPRRTRTSRLRPGTCAPPSRASTTTR